MVQVKDNDVCGAQLIGAAAVPAHRLLSGNLVSDWFSVIGPSGVPPKPITALRISMRYTPVSSNPLYIQGIAGDPEKLGVRGTYFPLRKGGSLALYQDAHVRDGELPRIELDDGKVFENQNYWEDICHAILEAHQLIYIVGWSIYDKVRLVRETKRPMKNGAPETLGGAAQVQVAGGSPCLLADLGRQDLAQQAQAGLRISNVVMGGASRFRGFDEPHELGCVCFVNMVAKENWIRYTAEKVVLLEGHLLMYPIMVRDDGMVSPLPGHNTFPEVGGEALGSHNTVLPDYLTM